MSSTKQFCRNRGAGELYSLVSTSGNFSSTTFPQVRSRPAARCVKTELWELVAGTLLCDQPKVVLSMSRKTQPEIVVRMATPEDSAVCGQICYDAFSTINAAHGFPCDLPGSEAATGLLSMMFSSPGFYCVVAEVDGRIVGSNCLDERSVIRGVGPITIDPGAQNIGVGRKLMQAVMDRANDRGAAGIRLVQAAFHNRSLSLYTSLGFDIREPLSCMQGRTLERSVPGCVVRPAKPDDADACNALSRRVHGFDRGSRFGAGDRAGNCARSRARRPRSPDTRRTWRFSAIPRRRVTWTCRRSLRRRNPSRGREFLCLQGTMFCCAGAWRMACAWSNR